MLEEYLANKTFGAGLILAFAAAYLNQISQVHGMAAVTWLEVEVNEKKCLSFTQKCLLLLCMWYDASSLGGMPPQCAACLCRQRAMLRESLR